jgi:hypothetical protein
MGQIEFTKKKKTLAPAGKKKMGPFKVAVAKA